MPKSKITINNVFEKADYMDILKVLYAYEDGLKFCQLVCILIGEKKLREMIKAKRAYLSSKTITNIINEFKYISIKQKNYLSITPKYKSPYLLNQRLRLLKSIDGLKLVEIINSKYRLTKTARDILSIKQRQNSLIDSFQFNNALLSRGEITVYPNPTFIEKYHESQKLKTKVDEILKNMEKSWNELRALIFANYKEDRKSTINSCEQSIKDKKFLEKKLKDKSELSQVLKELNENIIQHEELMNVEPQTIIIINPFDAPSKEDFFRFILEDALRDKISDIKIFSTYDMKNKSW
jgi:hypothetical protein